MASLRDTSLTIYHCTSRHVHGDPWAEVLWSFQIPGWKQKGTKRSLRGLQKRSGQLSHCSFLKALLKTYFYWRAYPDFTFEKSFKRIMSLRVNSNAYVSIFPFASDFMSCLFQVFNLFAVLVKHFGTFILKGAPLN